MGSAVREQEHDMFKSQRLVLVAAYCLSKISAVRRRVNVSNCLQERNKTFKNLAICTTIVLIDSDINKARRVGSARGEKTGNKAPPPCPFRLS